jgi:hypothetical protein
MLYNRFHLSQAFIDLYLQVLPGFSSFRICFIATQLGFQGIVD